MDAKGNITIRNNDKVRQVMDYAKRLFQHIPGEMFAADDATNNRALISGRSALIFNPPSAWAVAKRDAPQVAEQCWTVPMPAGTFYVFPKVEPIARRLGIPRSTVARILKRHGLERLKKLDPPVPARRYEKTRPGELIHLDIKKLGRIKGVGHRFKGWHAEVARSRGIGWEFVHVCVDDYTRLAYVEVLGDEKGATTAAFLRRAAAWLKAQGVTVERVMTDNGSGYVSKGFAAAVAEIRARHIRTRPYTPRTNGKAERFIQTMLREWAYGRPFASSYCRRAALPAWLRRYNEKRPHAGIGGASPITRLRSAA